MLLHKKWQRFRCFHCLFSFNFVDFLTFEKNRFRNNEKNRCDKKSMNFSSSIERENNKIARFFVLFVKFERRAIFAS